MSDGNTTLKEAFRHNAWASRQLLAFCAQLRPEQLAQPRPTPLAGEHGSILETFDHIVCSDGGYLGSLTGRRPPWAHERELNSDLGELAPRVDEAEALWMDFLSLADDAERRVLLDDNTYETRAAIGSRTASRSAPSSGTSAWNHPSYSRGTSPTRPVARAGSSPSCSGCGSLPMR
jgi:uncharacterized damage-inducible protein DinB